VSVGLDALPVDVLRTRIVAEVEKRMDLDALAKAEQFLAGYSEADSIYDRSGMKEWKPL
jgi:hypothetical protein